MAAPAVTDELLDLDDIQGLVMRGYGTLDAAQFLVLRVDDANKARAYLRELAPRINLARDSPKTAALQVAFSAAGLRELGVPKDTLDTFSREFLEGMDDDIRAQILGDAGDNAASNWTWGRRGDPVHVLLMIYATPEAFDDVLGAERRKATAGGMHVLYEKSTALLREDAKEHFGWRDGLSMPVFTGVPPERPKGKDQESWTTPIPAGEFVLGYRNDYASYSESPTVARADDPHDLLPELEHEGGRKSIGRNGTYLVYRELTQFVHGMWQYLAAESDEHGNDDIERATALGAKMVGRWPGGAPLVMSPDRDRDELSKANAFHYSDKDRRKDDRDGLKCPHGAHIRRANPRDVLAIDDRSASASISMVRKHQMIRRGRPFGRFVSEKMLPRELVETPPDHEHRGLHFICLVGNIDRQFEFVQRSWIDAANFDSMFEDGDPISAARRTGAHRNDTFTCPADPVRRKYKRMPAFTQLVGGGYFFLPGIRALKFIACAR